PQYLRALDLLPERIEEVKLIVVEVNDPDHFPFVAHLPIAWPGDLPPRLIAEAAAKMRSQLQEAASGMLDEPGERALSNGFLSALVHDVALVNGIIGRFGSELPSEAREAAIFDAGRGVHLAFSLPGGGRVAMTHLNLRGVPDYTERLTIYC